VKALLSYILRCVVTYRNVLVRMPQQIGVEIYLPMEFVPENCCQNMIIKPIANRLRLPGVRHSLQVTPSVALSSSSMEALISAISWMISGLSTDLHLTCASEARAFSWRPCLHNHLGLSLRKKRPMNMMPPKTSWIETGTRHCKVLEGMCLAQP